MRGGYPGQGRARSHLRVFRKPFFLFIFLNGFRTLFKCPHKLTNSGSAHTRGGSLYVYIRAGTTMIYTGRIQHYRIFHPILCEAAIKEVYQPAAATLRLVISLTLTRSLSRVPSPHRRPRLYTSRCLNVWRGPRWIIQNTISSQRSCVFILYNAKWTSLVGDLMKIPSTYYIVYDIL